MNILKGTLFFIGLFVLSRLVPHPPGRWLGRYLLPAALRPLRDPLRGDHFEVGQADAVGLDGRGHLDARLRLARPLLARDARDPHGHHDRQDYKGE